MSLSRSEVEDIAMLARLNVEDKEMSALVNNLSRIIEFVEQLNQADTRGVVPMAHPLDMLQRLREDRVTERDMRDRFQQNASLVEAGLYLVPKVID